MCEKELHPIKKANLKQGIESEDRLLTTFRNYFCVDLNKDPNKYATMDYYCDCCLVELKSRNVKKDTYTTTIIGMNKILYCLKSKKLCYFVFEFTDGLYYWMLNKFDLKEFEIKKGGTIKRGYDEINDYLYIPVDKLIKIDVNNNPPIGGCIVNRITKKHKQIINNEISI
jgi:hypothetical protein